MRQLLLALAAVAAIAIAIPASTTSADAKKGGHHANTKVMKVHTNRGLHLGWRKRSNHPHYYRPINRTSTRTIIVR